MSHELDPKHQDWILDPAWYLARYPDVETFGGTPWEHYVHLGDGEGRQPGPLFDPEFYTRCYLPLEGTHPGRHYIVDGRPIGLLPAPQPRSADESRRAMRAALYPQRPPIILIGHDAQRAGAPILLLGLASHYRLLGYKPVFILRSSGPLDSDFRALGTVFVLAEGWNLEGLAAAIPAGVPIIGNTGWSSLVMDEISDEGPRLLLIHEMVDYLREHDLLRSVARRQMVTVAMPSMVGPLERALAEVSSTVPKVVCVRPGLQTSQPTRRAVAAVRRELTQRWGAHVDVFIGAGYADRRKGFDRFLQAARSIAQLHPAAAFVWLGELSSWAKGLADEATSKGLRLHLPGFRKDATAWYAASQMYLLTSRQDPGPTTCMDAARAGVPFVGYRSDLGILSLEAELKGTAMFVPDDDVDVFARRALEVLATESPHARQDRAHYIAKVTAFSRYADAIVDTLWDAHGFRRPGRALSSIRRRLGWARSIKHALHYGPPALLQRLEHSTGLPLQQLSGASRLPSLAGDQRSIQLALYAPGAGNAPNDALRSVKQVAALEAGDRAWITEPSLLVDARFPVDLYLIRTPLADGVTWDATHSLVLEHRSSIANLTQYSTANLPAWVRQGARPPHTGCGPRLAPPPPDRRCGCQPPAQAPTFRWASSSTCTTPSSPPPC
ncbi:MAG: glycosyltransferase [Propionibacteriaceae bacterium]|nr:glycosyltransferase [Propionibacteriaceae bacterium]